MREARVHLSPADIRRRGLTRLLDRATDAGLRRFTEIQIEGSGRLYHVQLQRRVSEGTWANADNLQWWELLSDSSEGVSYLWKLQERRLGVTDRHSQNRGVEGAEDDLSETVELCIIGPLEELDIGRAGVSADSIDARLERITDYDGPVSPLDALTDRQLEVLQEAYRSGYFEVPRDASAKDVARRLSLDPSTVAEHLQRAERNLVRVLLPDLNE